MTAFLNHPVLLCPGLFPALENRLYQTRAFKNVSETPPWKRSCSGKNAS